MKFQISDKQIALAAVEDAKNFGLLAQLEEADGQNLVSYEKAEAYSIPSSPTPTDIECCVRDICSSYQYELKWLSEDMRSLRERFFKHEMDGHLPPIKDAGQMKKALKSLGLEDSYNVQTPTVYVQY
jgi:hypothetical protein